MRRLSGWLDSQGAPTKHKPAPRAPKAGVENQQLPQHPLPYVMVVAETRAGWWERLEGSAG